METEPWVPALLVPGETTGTFIGLKRHTTPEESFAAPKAHQQLGILKPRLFLCRCSKIKVRVSPKLGKGFTNHTAHSGNCFYDQFLRALPHFVNNGLSHFMDYTVLEL